MIFTVGYYHILSAFPPFFSAVILVYEFCELQTLIYKRINVLIEIHVQL